MIDEIIKEFKKEFGVAERYHPDYYYYLKFEDWLRSKLNNLEKAVRKEARLQANKQQIEELKSMYFDLFYKNNLDFEKMERDVHSAISGFNDALVVTGQTIDDKLSSLRDKEKE